jgi:hypothetical protein
MACAEKKEKEAKLQHEIQTRDNELLNNRTLVSIILQLVPIMIVKITMIIIESIARKGKILQCIYLGLQIFEFTIIFFTLLVEMFYLTAHVYTHKKKKETNRPV